ncbi:MAG: cytochrome b/b6 domain-containing protein [Pseudomonadota bacterium]
MNEPEPPVPLAPARLTRRWDPIVKLTHWGVVTIVIINALVVGEGSIAHIWAGYCLAALLALRLLWGLVGPQAARFTSFPPSPARAIAHIRDIAAGRKEEHRSHNPIGALMVYAIWATLAGVITTGVMMTGPPTRPSSSEMQSWQSLAYGEGGEEGENEQAEHGGEGGEEAEEAGEGEESGEAVAELHELFVNLLYVLIALHLMGVLFETRRSGAHIVRAMIPGAK